MELNNLSPLELALMMFFPLTHSHYSDEVIISHLEQHDLSSMYSLIVPSCVQNKRLVLLDYFIQKGVDIHMDNDYCIQQSCLYHDLTILEYLLHHGASAEVGLKYAKLYGNQEGLDFINYWQKIGYLKSQLNEDLPIHTSFPNEKI